MIDLALERDMKFFLLQPVANEDQTEALELMKHPRSVVTFSDSGAHVSQIMDTSLQTHLLSHWVREKQAFTLEEAVKLITYDTATQWGFHDRGLMREGMAADIVVFDPDTVGPRMPEVVTDLPAGAKRLKQTADGMLATIVNGQVLLRNNEPTGALPGKLVRGAHGIRSSARRIQSSIASAGVLSRRMSIRGASARDEPERRGSGSRMSASP